MLDSSAPAALAPEGNQPLARRQPRFGGNTEQALQRVTERNLRTTRPVAPSENGRRLNAEGNRDALLSAADLHKFGEGGAPARIGNVRHAADIYANRQFCQSGMFAGNVVSGTETGESLEMDSSFPERLMAVLRARGLTRPWGGKETAMVTKIAEMSGVGSSTILRYLEPRSAKQRPSAASLGPLAKAIGTTTAYLLDGDEPMLTAVEATEEPADVFATGERRFREWVADKEPQHLAKVPDFLRRLAEERRQRWPANVLATDVEEGLINEFRAYRRGEWDRDEPAGVPYVPAKRTAR